MNVFDFDHTIYDGDCSLRFYVFCLRKHPKLWWRLPRNVLFGLLFVLKCISRAKFKQVFYESFIPYVETAKEVREFWEKEHVRIKKWYLDMKTPTDLIISASPSFLITPIARRLRVREISSQVSPKTGVLESPNNRGEEKVANFKKLYPAAKIQRFYTDSRADLPLARLAERKFMVSGNIVKEVLE